MRALIAIGGLVRDHGWILREMDEPGFDLVAAADSGADHLFNMGIVPDLVLGDMDSVSADAKIWLQNAGTPARLYDVRKDGTDTELALDAAIGRGADEIVLLGSFSPKRPDHLQANLMLLAGLKEENPSLDIVLTDGLTFVRAVKGPERMVSGLSGLPDLPYIISLIPISARLEAVSYEGLAYPLDGAVLYRGRSRSVSNYCTDPEKRFAIQIGAGLGLVFITPEEITTAES